MALVLMKKRVREGAEGDDATEGVSDDVQEKSVKKPRNSERLNILMLNVFNWSLS